MGIMLQGDMVITPDEKKWIYDKKFGWVDVTPNPKLKKLLEKSVPLR